MPYQYHQQEMDELAARARALIRERDAEIERLKGEVVKWQIEAGKFGAGCPACDDIGEENERLRAALTPFAAFADLVANEHPGWDHDSFRITDDLTMAPFRAARAIISHEQNGQDK